MNKEQSQVLAQALEAMKEAHKITIGLHLFQLSVLQASTVGAALGKIDAAIASIESLQLQEQPHLAANGGGLLPVPEEPPAITSGEREILIDAADELAARSTRALMRWTAPALLRRIAAAPKGQTP